jgi:4-carboxymuconolactone decarboxylase
MGPEALLELSAAVASRDQRALERTLHMVARFCDPAEVDEVLLQAHLFVGFPIALEALMLWRKVLPDRDVDGAEEDAAGWAGRGEAVCRSVYGRGYEKLRANVQRLHPDLDRWMVVGGYGRVIGRPRLDLATRELCVVALLAVWNAPRQLHSHLRGAVNVGASERDVESALEVAGRYLDPEASRRVWQLWAAVRGGAKGGAGAPDL